jgi:hypothetical protein
MSKQSLALDYAASAANPRTRSNPRIAMTAEHPLVAN